jgi:hypothetical protein
MFKERKSKIAVGDLVVTTQETDDVFGTCEEVLLVINILKLKVETRFYVATTRNDYPFYYFVEEIKKCS